MANKLYEENDIQAIANAIRAKGQTGTMTVSQMAGKIADIPTGGGGSDVHGVHFLDYDGSVVEEWDTDSVASKTALPNNPSHTGLVAQGWNWSLANIKGYVSKYENADVYVGQMYETASRLTEIDITVTKATGLTVTCNMVGNKDWGDGVTDSTTTHTYTNYGDYTVTCDGTALPAGSTSAGGMFGSSSTNTNRYWCTAIRLGRSVTSIGNYAFYYCSSLTSITIPNSVTRMGTNSFQNCYSLTSITIPDSVTSIGSSAFQNCYSLTSITIPDSVMSISTQLFYYCYSLTSITIPDSVTSIGSSTFQNCYSLTSITIPDSVTSIGASAFQNCYSLTSIHNSIRSAGSSSFQNCYSLTSIVIGDSVTAVGSQAFYHSYIIKEYDFSFANSVPKLVNTDAFSGISRICKIIVPDALYSSWIAATNWSTYADYIYKASEV